MNAEPTLTLRPGGRCHFFGSYFWLDIHFIFESCPIQQYRYKVLEGDVGREVHNCIRVFAGYKACEVVELNVQIDHVHLIIMVPPKVSISDLLGTLKGRTAIRVFKQFPYLKNKPYWGNHFWSPGYCVDTVGLDADMIRKYVKYQEDKERREEQLSLKFK